MMQKQLVVLFQKMTLFLSDQKLDGLQVNLDLDTMDINL